MKRRSVHVTALLAGLLALLASLAYLTAPGAAAAVRGGTAESPSGQAAGDAITGDASAADPLRRPPTHTPRPTKTPVGTPTLTPTPVNTPTNTPTATPLPSCGLLWREVSPAHPATAFYGIDVVSANDIWAVGIEYSSNPARMLIEHWDGTSWSIVPSPDVGTDVAYLFEVSAVSANDIWAVGTRNSRTLAIHWNGVQWSIFDTPNPGGHENYIVDVVAISANDAWAVGYHRSAPTYASVPLAIHWDGKSWSQVPSPNPGFFSTAFSSVDAISTNDIWAVGSTTATQFGHAQTLTMHWNGSNWSVVPTPEPANDQIYLNDLDAISSNDAWAVGYFTSLDVGGDVPLLLHWDGTQWNMDERDWGIAPDYLTTVAGVSGTDVWASGYNYTDGVFFMHYSDPCALPDGAKR